jgi:hypothetical protein
MSKAAAHDKTAHSHRGTRSNSSIVERQNPLSTHVCIQREASGLGVQPHAPALVREVVNSPGQALDPDTRSFMEPQLGHDFSGVRVHTDATAAESARAVSAKAYTAGSHVVFGAGQHAPGSTAGQRLIAHELTHVVQQATGPVEGTKVAEGFSVSHPRDSFERRASAVAADLSRDHRVNRPAPGSLGTKGARSAELHVQRVFGLDTGEAASVSAWSGLASAGAGIWSAISAERQADIAKDSLSVSKQQLSEAKEQNVIGKDALAASLRQADAAEAQQTTVEGLAITHASVADFNPEDKAAKKSDLIVPLLQMGIGSDDLAEYRLRLQIDEKGRIRGGSTEESDAQGYVGGLGGSNASVTFSATQESVSPDRLLIQFRGTNVAAKRKGIQRIHGEVTIIAAKAAPLIRNADPLVSHPSDRNTKQANGPWALVPPYQAPPPQTKPATPPTSPQKKGGSTSAQSKKGGAQ